MVDINRSDQSDKRTFAMHTNAIHSWTDEKKKVFDNSGTI
jgi:hypothetical protein